ncbi:MAG TPA: fasciclin domain-containing protein [Prolixibacteraceae bacterium]|nr:fasciclin domain-containing protein [Prolixibacteraceae bacterium]
MKDIRFLPIVLIIIGFSTFLFQGCDEPDYVERTNYELLIGEYFEQQPDSFSTFLDVLKRSETLAFLKAYGVYTCFAPTNEAFTEYFASKGIDSLGQMSTSELKDLVRFCVIRDTISSEIFVDGRMNTPTLYGQYLTYGTYYEDGSIVKKINKYAVIDRLDIRLSNGIVHALNNVLEPEVKTIAQYVESTEGYSIFTRALKETGLFDSLNVLPSPQNDTTWYTFFAVSDEVLKADGIRSFDELKLKYQTEERPNGLYLYMAYHILQDQYHFVSDLISSKTVATKAPSEVLTIRTSGTDVLINDDYFAGIYEPGFVINRSHSDQTAGNGVVHFMDGNFAIKVRYPFAVYWDVCDQIELRKMPGVFRKNGQSNLANGTFANISWEPQDAVIHYNANNTVNGDNCFIFRDWFHIDFRPEIVKSITLTTPTLVKGTYKIWVGTRSQASSSRQYKAYVYFNGEQTSKILDGAKCYSSYGKYATDGELNQNGMKIYQYDPSHYYTEDTAQIQTMIDNGRIHNWLEDPNGEWGRYLCQDGGTVVVNETGSHTIQFVATAGGNGSYFRLDMIQFIPVEEDQNWPRVNIKDGSLVYRDDLEAGIFPKN